MQPKKTHLNQRTLKLLKNWTWQFVIIRPICSILMIMLQITGMYPTWLSWTFTIILNLSFSLAMYSLVVFYHVFAKELEPHTPLAKFICIKGIIFFCFWQVQELLCTILCIHLYMLLLVLNCWVYIFKRNSPAFLHLSFSFKFCIKITRSTAIIINKQDNFSCTDT